MFGFAGAPLTDPGAIYYFKNYLFFLVAAALASIPWKQVASKLPTEVAAPLCVAGSWLKPVVATLLFLASLAMIITQSYNPFLYFRF
jgi:alginate O-acetyltransferase complex protein AlgI